MPDLHKTLASAVRALSIDMIEEAGSGHPGMPLGFADVATVLFRYFLKFHPNYPTWENRDRLILSAGHGSALLYSLLYLTGYKHYTIQELKNFRKLNSLTPGHPEYNPKLGIETTTGPLGQGLANGIGMGIAQKILSTKLGGNLNHKIYIIVGDGCLMEGISHEALSLAGHLNLNNIIVLFDDNRISIDGSTSITSSDMNLARVASYNWDVMSINGHNHERIYEALNNAQTSSYPTFISCRTKIGYSSPNFENTEHAHGKALGKKEIELIKEKLNWSYNPFIVPDEILKKWRNFYKRNVTEHKKWNLYHKKAYDEELLKKSAYLEIPKITENEFKNTEATRKTSNKILSKISHLFIGGSADLSQSNGTITSKHKIISKNNFEGNYIYYGIREHAMVSIMNGMNIYGLRSYGGTFLVFSDYCRPSIRLSAIMNLPILLILTHDSIAVGEDGPTHQPVEQLSSLRAIPNLNLFRPADSLETLECWKFILLEKTKPSILCLTRQETPYISKKNDINLGGYVVYGSEKSDISIFSSGSEVALSIETAKLIEKELIKVKVVSIPCHEIFHKSDYAHKNKFYSKLNIAIEAEIGLSWRSIIGRDGIFFGVNSFGKSSTTKELYLHFGLTPNIIAKKILKNVN